ncbi:MAG: penicillin acylase family protein, partial [Aestuariivita sp.]|uniref:penicillin acylase family protein n=1 Tax=Aestuariivita sp. TaxID=1872407 RepID=UPI003BB0D747
ALNTWGAPSVNMVYADTAGDICWQAAAYVPQRTGWRGLMPVAGDGRYEWTGYMTAADLPAIVNPACGFVHSANEMNLPATWDHTAHPVGFEWFEDGRANRIAHVISEGGARDVAGNCALQCDAFSQCAVDLVALLPTGGAAAALLQSWDGHANADSAPALLFEVWLSLHLRPALLAQIAPDATLRAYLTPGNIPTVVRILRGDLPDLMPADRDALLADTLSTAWQNVCDRFGDNPTEWRWGDLHKGYFDHALTPLGGSADVGPVATAGSSTTVMMGHYEARDFRVRNGASVRMVVDVGAWDNSVWINAPGQSGTPGVAHYDDLTALWAAGAYVPMLYSAPAVDAATRTLIKLVPQRG